MRFRGGFAWLGTSEPDRSGCSGGSAVPRRLFSGIPGCYSLDASSTSENVRQPKMSEALTDVPQGDTTAPS